MKISDFERAIERAHAPEAPPADVQSEQLRFEAVGEAGSNQAQSPPGNGVAPTQPAHSDHERATRIAPGSRGTAVGYIRVSREDQTPGDSLATQRVEIDRYCERKGYELVRNLCGRGSQCA